MSQASQLIAGQYRNSEINKRMWVNAFYYVKTYGAIGDGLQDDSNSIQKAIDAAYSGGGGIVYFTPGTYVVQGLDIKSNVALLGQGESTILKQRNSANAGIIIASNASNISVLNLQFDGNKSKQGNPTGLDAIKFTSCDNVLVENISVKNTYYGTGVITDTCTNVKIQDSVFSGLGGNGVLFTDTKYLSIMSNRMESCAQRGVTNLGTIENGSMYIEIADNKIENCTLDGVRMDYVMTPTSYYYTVKEVGIRHNQIINNKSHGITVRGESIHINDNYVIGNNGQGIVVQGLDSIIDSNTIKENTGTGIDLGNCNRSVASSNLIKNNIAAGVECNSSEDVVISSNIILNNNTTTPPAGTADYYASGIIVHQDGVLGNTTPDYWKWEGNSKNVVIADNRITRNNSLQKYGIYLKENVTGVSIQGNVMGNSGSVHDLFTLTTSFAESGNVMVWSDLTDLVLPSATYISIRNETSFFKISGTTTINGILNWGNGKFQTGKRLTIMFQSALTINDSNTAGGNIALTGHSNLAVTAGGSILQLVWDGTLWSEVSRSLK